MTIVQHKLTDAAGNPLVNVRVPIRLATNGYVTADQREIVRLITVTTDATGMYQANLLPQSQIDPAGTHYEVTHPPQTAGSQPSEILSFVVTDDTGPLWLRNLLVENPTQPSPVIAGGGGLVSIDGGTP